MIGWIVSIAFVFLVLYAADRALLVKEIRQSMIEYLGDIEVLRDAFDEKDPQRIHVHFTAEVLRFKSLVKKHFTL